MSETNFSLPFFEDYIQNNLKAKNNDLFKAALAKARFPYQVIELLAKYIYFNAPFGAGVAHLASTIAVQYDLFKDRNQELEFIADCSTEVAVPVYFASIDEFRDRSARYNSSHRMLAQATFLGVVNHYPLIHRSEIKRICKKVSDDLIEIREQVLIGYGFNRLFSEIEMFKSMGFHIASELLADKEFNILYHSIATNHSELAKSLQRNKVSINGTELPPYHWIKIHTSVEAEHRDAAVQAVLTAINHYVGKLPVQGIEQLILQGFNSFYELQANFMKKL